MEKEKIDRINFLARKSKTEDGLTEAEKSEQAALREEYIESWRRGVKASLDNVYIEEADGTVHKLKKKSEK